MAGNTPQQGKISLQNPLSRHKRTKVFMDPDTRKVFFGTWRPPKIIENRPPMIHIVTPDELTRPDLISYRVYGDQSLFWAIALRNNIFLAMRDIVVGTNLICPHIEDIAAALTLGAENSPVT